MAEQPLPSASEARRLAWIGYGLVAAMLTCLVTALVQAVQLFLPAWQGEYLAVFSFLAALEAIWAQRNLGGRRFPEKEWFLFRLTEWVVLLLALKAASYAASGLHLLKMDLLAWPQNFLESFFNPEFFFDTIVIALVWLQSNWFAQNLAVLEVPEAPEFYRADRKEDIRSGLMRSRTEASEQLLSQFLTIGMILTLLTALLRSRTVASWLNLPVFQGGMSALIWFFILGFVLLSVVQFSNLHLRWNFEGIQVSREIARRWLGYSFGFLLILALLVSLLPTGYSLGLLTLLKQLFGAAAAVVGVLLSILLTLIFLPIWWLISWLGGLLGAGEALPPFKPPSFEAPPSVGGQAPWWELLKSLVFWIVFLGVIAYSLGYYFSAHRESWAWLRKWAPVRFLLQIWEWLRGGWQAAGAGLGRVGRRSWQGLRRLWSGQAASAESWLRLNSLSPRQRVIFTFLALVRRGKEAGLPRHPAQTAGEYAQQVKNWMPEEEGVQAALQALTDDFLEARYSAHQIPENQARHAQGLWQQISRAFRRRQRSVR